MGPPCSGLIFQIDVHDPRGHRMQQALLAIPPEGLERLQARPRWGRLGDRLFLKVKMELPGPAVPRSELTELAQGDFLMTSLTPNAAWPARLTVLESGVWAAGRLDQRSGAFEAASPLGIPHQTLEDQMTGSALHEAEQAPQAPSADDRGARRTASAALKSSLVDLRIATPVLRVPVRALAELGPGCVIDLSMDEILRVEVLADGSAIARGELVALGPGFGVLIEELI
jgi:flagellar motor switch/type III secretory pathway protein FliN